MFMTGKRHIRRYSADLLSKAEQIIDAALQTGRFTWKDIRPLSNQLVERLSVPYNEAPDLVKMVYQRKRTLAVLAVFAGAQTLEEAATEARIPRSELLELFKSRKRTLAEAFGLPGRTLDDAIEQLDDALLSRNPETIAEVIKSLLSGPGNQEHRSETVSVGKLHDVMEWLVRELSGVTSNEKGITQYRTSTTVDGSQSAQTALPQAGSRRKNTPY
jgi:hypothetical protein